MVEPCPYMVGDFVDGIRIIEVGFGGYHEPSKRNYWWAKLENGEFRDTSIDDVPIEQQNITSTHFYRNDKPIFPTDKTRFDKF